MEATDWTEIAEEYRGKWVALEDDEKTVIASAGTPVEVLEKAKKLGLEHPIIVNVPNHTESFIGKGL